MNEINPGAESLIFKPSKVSWVVNSYLARQNNRNLKWFVYSVLFVCVSFITWCGFSEKAIVIDATGEIIAKSPPIPVTTSSSMTIHSIKVKDNEAVKKGDILVVSTRDLSEADQKKIGENIEHIQKNIDLDKKKQCGPTCFAELRMIADGGFPWMARLDSNSELSRSVSELNRYFKDYMTQYSALNELPTTTASLRFEIKNTQRQMNEIKKRNAEKILAMEYDQLHSKLVSLDSQLKEKTLGSRSSLNGSRNLVEISLQAVPTALKTYSADAVIRAPIDGTVSFVDLKGDGQIISPGQLLLYVNSEKSVLGAKLKLPDSDIAKVKKGMQVKLDISSYPASEYGVQESKVTEIPEKIAVAGRQADNTFDVYLDLEGQGVSYHGKTYPLRSGVSLRAKIIVKHEQLLFYYLKKLLSIKDDYLGDS